MVAYKEYSYMLNSVVVSGGIHAYTACSVIFSGELMGSFFLDFIVLCLLKPHSRVRQAVTALTSFP